MAIRKEALKGDLLRTFSDEGFRIRNVETGEVFDEALDPIHIMREYEETDELIIVNDDDEVVESEVLQ